jgi:hypothetical protein
MATSNRWWISTIVWALCVLATPAHAQFSCRWPDCLKDTTSGRSATAPGNYFDIQANSPTINEDGYFCDFNAGGGLRITDSMSSDQSAERRWIMCDGEDLVRVPSMPPFHLSFAFSNVSFATLLSSCLPRWPQAATSVTPCADGTSVTNAQKLGITVNRAHDWPWLSPLIGKLTCTVSAATGVDAGDQIAFEVLKMFGPSIRQRFSQPLVLNYTTLTSADPTASADVRYAYLNFTSGDSFSVRVTTQSVDTGTAMTAISGHCELYGHI